MHKFLLKSFNFYFLLKSLIYSLNIYFFYLELKREIEPTKKKVIVIICFDINTSRRVVSKSRGQFVPKEKKRGPLVEKRRRPQNKGSGGHNVT
jgi:hypothetical protein